MAVRLRLKRMGRTNRAFFRIHVCDSRSPLDGRVIEQLGHYDPIEKDEAKALVIDIERAKHWLDKGAQASETVSSLLKKKGLEHKGLNLPKPGKPKPKAEEAKKE
ncbi:MAG: 30S ribosomal protein S16 [Tepidisphaeraceae bacterium]